MLDEPLSDPGVTVEILFLEIPYTKSKIKLKTDL